jgi:hypothetical protein
MSNSYAKRSITSSPLTMHKRLPLNGVRMKSSNSLFAIISLIFVGRYLPFSFPDVLLSFSVALCSPFTRITEPLPYFIFRSVHGSLCVDQQISYGNGQLDCFRQLSDRPNRYRRHSNSTFGLHCQQFDVDSTIWCILPGSLPHSLRSISFFPFYGLFRCEEYN